MPPASQITEQQPFKQARLVRALCVQSMNAHTHTHTYACTHTHIHTRTCTHTHTHAHTHREKGRERERKGERERHNDIVLFFQLFWNKMGENYVDFV